MNVYQEQEDKPLQDTAPRPRLCHVTKWDHFDGYGFNLHAEKSRPGQYIGKVDESSPAEKAGLKEGDRIIEVNGVNINHENHKQVVSRIKASPNETRLLVVDAEAENFFKDHDIVIHGELSNVLRMSSEPGPAQGVPIIVETIEIENHNEPDGPSSPSSMAINTTTTTTTLNNYSRNVRQNSVEDDDQHSNHSAMSAGSSTAKVKDACLYYLFVHSFASEKRNYSLFEPTLLPHANTFHFCMVHNYLYVVGKAYIYPVMRSEIELKPMIVTRT
eukprot:TCALIF_04849-PA protein Name:"Similar to SLC9A3R1 Na(+)/H(+) exchange regulatory cofactor NHE-RF1 (Homo sapiens)" AED:0.17 eAED:0.17 QI:0/-1/0/1/-1/1/1/0/272